MTSDKTPAAGFAGTDIENQWSDICARLRGEVGDTAWQSWLKPMAVRGLEDGRVRFAVPTRFMRDWVLAHYAERIAKLWAAVNPAVGGVDLLVQSDRVAVKAPAGPAIGAIA